MFVFQGMSALHWAAFHNRPEHVQLLVERGADILLQDVDGKLPLHWAAQVSPKPFQCSGYFRLKRKDF